VPRCARRMDTVISIPTANGARMLPATLRAAGRAWPPSAIQFPLSAAIFMDTFCVNKRLVTRSLYYAPTGLAPDRKFLPRSVRTGRSAGEFGIRRRKPARFGRGDAGCHGESRRGPRSGSCRLAGLELWKPSSPVTCTDAGRTGRTGPGCPIDIGSVTSAADDH
jgi:hypothetical protein